VDIKEGLRKITALAAREELYRDNRLRDFRVCQPEGEACHYTLQALASMYFDAAVHDARAKVLTEAADWIEKEASKP